MAANRIAKFILLGLFLLFAMLVTVRFIALRGRTPAKSIDEIQEEEGIPVDVTVVGRGMISKHLDLLGRIQGIEQAEITSSLPIDITKILKREGEQVRKGEVVIQLARGRIGNSYHQFAMARQALENAERDLERIANLHKEGAVSAQVLEKARLGLKNARAQFDRARSMVDLVAPISGIVTMINATEGSAAIPGVPLMTVAATDRVRIRCSVGQGEVGMLAPGQKAYIRLSSWAGSVGGGEGGGSFFEGEVNHVSLSADEESKLFMAEIVADNPGGVLKPGLTAYVSVLVEKKEGVVKVPVDAVMRGEKGPRAYLVRGGRAFLVPVSLGIANGEQTEIIDGISEGDTLVTRGQYRLSHRAKVKIHGLER